MSRFIHFGKAWFAAWLATYLLASIFHTQMVLVGLTAIGVEVPLSERVATTAYDIYGLFLTYGLALVAASGLAMLITVGVWRLVGRLLFLPALAGGAAIFTALMVMQPIMYVTLIAGARGAVGMTLQVLAGVIGGVVFSWVYMSDSSDE